MWRLSLVNQHHFIDSDWLTIFGCGCGSLNPSRQLQWISRWSAQLRRRAVKQSWPADTRHCHCWLTWEGGRRPWSRSRGCPAGPGPGTETSALSRPWPRCPHTASDSLAGGHTCRESDDWGHSRYREASTSSCYHITWTLSSRSQLITSTIQH